MKTLRIGSRGSKLALWQANTVARLMSERGRACEIVVIRTSGDEAAGPPDAPRVPEVPGVLSSSAKNSFVKEIEDALLEGRVDLAVHSSKDLSAVLPGNLVIAAVLERDDPRDAVLLPQGESVHDLDALLRRLGSEPRFGTSSVRRIAQLRAMFPRASFVPMRGNVDTRVRKLDAGQCDAGVLASAGLRRLGLERRISLALGIDACIPAPGQGIVAIEIREDGPESARAVTAINNAAAMDALTAERAIVRALGGGCQMPLGAHARVEGDHLAITAIVTAVDASRVIRDEVRGRRSEAAALGISLAEAMLERGAADILGTGRA